MNLILSVKRTIGAIIEPAKNVFHSLGEIREAKRINKKKLVTVNFVETNGTVRELKGKLDYGALPFPSGTRTGILC